MSRQKSAQPCTVLQLITFPWLCLHLLTGPHFWCTLCTCSNASHHMVSNSKIERLLQAILAILTFKDCLEVGKGGKDHRLRRSSMLSLGKQVLQWMVWLPAGVLLQIYSVWSSLCGVHRDSCIISGTCSLGPIQSSCGCQPAWWQRVSSTMSHIDASLTLAQRSKSDGQCLSNSSSRDVKRWHRLQPWPWHDQHASPWCWPATDSSAVVS